MVTVHPHARGERISLMSPRRYCIGSSPRPWGTLFGSAEARMMLRFIPTPVGNAVAMCGRYSPIPVHPHARGERRRIKAIGVEPYGSSPRPWGTPPADWKRIEGARFIPTPVGNACPTGGTRSGRTVHPHARGERGTRYGLTVSVSGSSPRPWGTPTAARCGSGACRFIPTPVGNALILSH